MRIRFCKLTGIFFLLFSCHVVFAQYTNDATLISLKRATAVVKASGIHEKKKEATQMAIKSAFDTYFFYGIEGLNNNMPLLKEDAASASAGYLERFFDDKTRKYLSFVATYEEDKDPEKMPNKLFKATVTLEIYIDALSKDLLRNKVELNVLVEKTVADIQEEVYQPTIMVVPYKQQNLDYRTILRQTQFVDLRTAIANVQDAFIKKGYEIKDVMAVLDATEKSGLFETNTAAESFDAQLINNSGADVYVTVDAGYNTNDEGGMGSIALVAYERASGKVLASKHTTTQRYRKGTLADLYRIAIGIIVDDFLHDMTANYDKKSTMGNTFVLRVTADNNSAVLLDSQVQSLGGIPLSDAIRMWLRKNAVNGRFHVQGATRDLVVFDEIQIASKSAAGYFLDANDFALDIYNYIRNELNISCEKRVDGNTVYITIND